MAERITICKEHSLLLFYRGDNCPWCEFVEEVRMQLTDEYKRGFKEGLEAAKLVSNEPGE